MDLKTGEVRWKKEVNGGVVSPVAVTGKTAIYTATDGKVRSIDTTTGELNWTYDAKSPMFAGAAIADSTIYVADLRGVIHAVGLATGEVVWTLDLGQDATVKAPGMAYGSPVVHGGRLYLATCNLEGEWARKPAVVVCLGDK
jgi:outer membrane protein assembly factor BamB